MLLKAKSLGGLDFANYPPLQTPRHLVLDSDPDHPCSLFRTLHRLLPCTSLSARRLLTMLITPIDSIVPIGVVFRL